MKCAILEDTTYLTSHKAQDVVVSITHGEQRSPPKKDLNLQVELPGSKGLLEVDTTIMFP